MVTWAQLGLTALTLVAVTAGPLGLLMLLAGGMSSAPSSGAAMGKRGCVTVLLGLVALGFAVAGWLS
jgi:hypothetical protein